MMKRLILVVAAVLAVLGAYVVGSASVTEYRAFRAQQAAVQSMFSFLAAEVGTRTEGETTKPVSRADVLALVAEERLKAAAAQAPAPPVAK